MWEVARLADCHMLFFCFSQLDKNLRACVCMCVCASLPEVPSLWDTACVCVDLPRDNENIHRQLVDAVRDYGRVLSHAPVQITDVSERPAALLVHWAEVHIIYYFGPTPYYLYHFYFDDNWQTVHSKCLRYFRVLKQFSRLVLVS